MTKLFDTAISRAFRPICILILFASLFAPKLTVDGNVNPLFINDLNKDLNEFVSQVYCSYSQIVAKPVAGFIQHKDAIAFGCILFILLKGAQAYARGGMGDDAHIIETYPRLNFFTGYRQGIFNGLCVVILWLCVFKPGSVHEFILYFDGPILLINCVCAIPSFILQMSSLTYDLVTLVVTFGMIYACIITCLSFLEICTVVVRHFSELLPFPSEGDVVAQIIFVLQTYAHQYRTQICNELSFNLATSCLRVTKHNLPLNWTTITLTHEDIAAAFNAYPNLKFSVETIPQHLCALFLVFLGTLTLCALVTAIYGGVFVIISNVLTVVAAIIGTGVNSTGRKETVIWFGRKFDIAEAHCFFALEKYIVPFMVYYSRGFRRAVNGLAPIIVFAGIDTFCGAFSWGQHEPYLASVGIVETCYYIEAHFVRMSLPILSLLVVFYTYPFILCYLIGCSTVPLASVVAAGLLTILLPLAGKIISSVLFFATLKLIIKIVCLLVAIAYYTLAERKIMASVQRRAGPNVVGLGGLLQPLADGLKLFGKEFIIPSSANSSIFILAPMGVLGCAFMAWQAVPFCLVDTSTLGLTNREVASFLLRTE